MNPKLVDPKLRPKFRDKPRRCCVFAGRRLEVLGRTLAQEGIVDGSVIRVLSWEEISDQMWIAIEVSHWHLEPNGSPSELYGFGSNPVPA